MPQIYITPTFAKQLGKEQRLSQEIFREIKKYISGSKNLIDVYSPKTDLKVLKAYLKSGKIRAAILLKVSKEIYIPFFIAKKESKEGWNLSKYSENFLYSKIVKIQNDIEQKNYKKYDV